MKFKIGDRVRWLGWAGLVVEKDYQMEGYVVEVRYPTIGIQFDGSRTIVYCSEERVVLIPQTEKRLYFDGVRVGDKVYSVSYGEGFINNINFTNNSPISIDVTFYPPFEKRFFCTSSIKTYSLDGVEREGFPQTLFWTKPEFKIPEKPKRKVKKIIEGWINIYHSDLNRIYKAKDYADEVASKDRLGEAVFIRHEYEEC